MATTIKLKNGSGAPAASDLVQGEPALDLTNKRLYSENSSGTVVEIGSNPSALSIAGTAVTSTAAELNILDGVTSTAAELNILDGVTSTTAELNILDGVTATAAELNIMDGVTATTAELNIMDGVTSTAAELNILDGVTSFLDEDNMASDSATSIPSQQSVKAYVQAQTGTSPGSEFTSPIINAGAQLKNGATSAGYLEFFEDSDNGTNKVTLIGPAATADVTITLPATADTLVGKTTTDTLTNKTLTTPVINAGAQLKNGATGAGFLEFFEDSDNGTNKVTLIGPASTADITLTLPSSDGDADQFLQTDGSGTMSWATAGGAYTAFSLKTTNYTASASDQLICNHASTAFTITLPASPTAMDTVVICNAGAATVTVARNSSNINSTASDHTLVQGTSTQLVYVDGTIGWFEI